MGPAKRGGYVSFAVLLDILGAQCQRYHKNSALARTAGANRYKQSPDAAFEWDSESRTADNFFAIAR